jgi:hypothetical protein
MDEPHADGDEGESRLGLAGVAEIIGSQTYG